MMLLLQEAPLETTNYMVAGYAVIFIVMAIYLISLAIRSRNLQQDIQVLQEIEEQEASTEAAKTRVS